MVGRADPEGQARVHREFVHAVGGRLQRGGVPGGDDGHAVGAGDLDENRRGVALDVPEVGDVLVYAAGHRHQVVFARAVLSEGADDAGCFGDGADALAADITEQETQPVPVGDEV